jgi:hypothetical protein
MNLPILNRDAARDARDGWYHIVPKGKFLHKPSGLMQVLDETAHVAIVNRFEEDAKAANFGGLLIDEEHFSYDDGKRSAAYGWIKELTVEREHPTLNAHRSTSNKAAGVWAKIQWTSEGKKAVEDGIYRFISPVFLPGDVEKVANKEIRPKRLDSAGLTNNPNLRGMVPLSNRAMRSLIEESSPARQEEGLVFLSEQAAAGRAMILANRFQLRNGGSFDNAWEATRAEHATLVPQSMCLRGGTSSAGAMVNRASAGVAAIENDAQKLVEKLRPIFNRMDTATRSSQIQSFLQPQQPAAVSGELKTLEQLLDEASEFEEEAYAALEQSMGRTAGFDDMMPRLNVKAGTASRIFVGLIKKLKAGGMTFGAAWEWCRNNQPTLFAYCILEQEGIHYRRGSA